jgi:hypothetical protein
MIMGRSFADFRPCAKTPFQQKLRLAFQGPA